MLRQLSMLLIAALLIANKGSSQETAEEWARTCVGLEGKELHYWKKKFEIAVKEENRLQMLARILEVSEKLEDGEKIKSSIISYLIILPNYKWQQNTELLVQIYACINAKNQDLRTVVFNLMQASFTAEQLRPIVLIYLADKYDFNRNRALSNVKKYEDRRAIAESYYRQNNGIEEYKESTTHAAALLKNDFK